jgi:hypothetical protein
MMKKIFMEKKFHKFVGISGKVICTKRLRNFHCGVPSVFYKLSLISGGFFCCDVRKNLTLFEVVSS